jgi:ubiquinone/menaquinone biosynthesis C-methylase UbiE
MTDRPALPKNVSRVVRSKKDARAGYDRLSRWYDGLAGSEGWFTQKTLEMAAVQPGEAVLEIGFGTGRTLLQLARLAGAAGEINGIDLSWGMTSLTRRKLAAEQLSEKVRLNLADGAALPYPARRFDLVFMAFTLELFDTPELPCVLDECWRVLRPNGRVGIVSMAQAKGFSPMVSAYEWFHRKFPAVADCRPIPAVEFVRAAGFEMTAWQVKAMWGLPVEMMIGKKVENGR